MSYPTLIAFLTVLLLGPIVQAEPTAIRTSEKEGISVEAPASWTPKAVQDPILLLLNDPKNQYAFIVFREIKADMGVADLKEYFEFKLEKISGAWESAKLDEPQTSRIKENGVSVHFLSL